MNWEYLVIGFLFIAALIYLWQKVIIPFSSKRNDSCGTGCGCSVDIEQLESKKKEY